jgi:signal transduction histidine kinase
MTLRARLVLGVFAIALVLLLPVGIALRSLHDLRLQIAQLRSGEFSASLLLGELRSRTDDVRRAEDALIIVHDTAARARFTSQIAALSATGDSLQRYALDSAALELRAAVQDVARLAPAEADAALAMDTTRADSISSHGVRPALARVSRSLARAEVALRGRTASRVETAGRASDDAEQLTALALLLAGVLATGIGVWLTRSISRPVRDLEEGMAQVAAGDFSHRLSFGADRRDEFGRLAESYRAMADQLAELDKLKAEFVSVASHELKTPLNVMLGYLQLLQEDVFGALSPQQKEICHTIETQGKSLNRLVKQLLDVSRFEAGGGKLDARPLELPRFLHELEAAFQVLARQRGVQFHVLRGAGLPREVVWDQDRMNEVLGNLLSNAFKFTDRGGRVELIVEAAGDSVQMDVRDTGAGIDPSQLPHVFEKFYQANNQAQAAAKGTGLGLAIAKEIVGAHGGAICCDSTPGVGTTFSITLPARVHTGRRSSTQRRAVEEASV